MRGGRRPIRSSRRREDRSYSIGRKYRFKDVLRHHQSLPLKPHAGQNVKSHYRKLRCSVSIAIISRSLSWIGFVCASKSAPLAGSRPRYDASVCIHQDRVVETELGAISLLVRIGTHRQVSSPSSSSGTDCTIVARLVPAKERETAVILMKRGL